MPRIDGWRTAAEITKLNTNLSNAYDAVEEKGGTIPAAKNFDNLATSIDSISSGSDTYTVELLLEDIVRHGSLEQESTVVAQTTSILQTILGE